MNDFCSYLLFFDLFLHFYKDFIKFLLTFEDCKVFKHFHKFFSYFYPIDILQCTFDSYSFLVGCCYCMHSDGTHITVYKHEVFQNLYKEQPFHSLICSCLKICLLLSYDALKICSFKIQNLYSFSLRFLEKLDFKLAQ